MRERVLLSKGIHSSLELELPSNAHSIVEKYSCNSHSNACMMGKCEDCTPDKILNIDGFDGKKDVKFFKWFRENKNLEKIEVILNPFLANVSILYPLKTPEKI